MSNSKTRKTVLVIVTLLLTFLLVVGSVRATTHELSVGLTWLYGSPSAHSLQLKDLNGVQYRLRDLRGKVVLVNFWATWCPPCIEEMPSMQRAYSKFGRERFEILAINAGEETSVVDAFLTRFTPALEFPILIDPTGETYKAWDVRGMPTTVIVDRQGHMRYQALGGRNINSEHIMGKLQELIDE